MRRAVFILLAVGSSVLLAQTTSGTIQGTVTDDQNKPVAGAIVIITRTFATFKDVSTPYSQTVKTASDGSFVAQNLPPGTYSYCAQVPEGAYLDGCHWNTPLLDAQVSAGQKLRAVIRVTKGSVLKVRIVDPGRLTAGLTSQQSNGKSSLAPVVAPPIQMTIWDRHGRLLPVQFVSSDQGGLNYRLTIPYDTPLNFQVVSTRLKLNDVAGVSLPASANGNAVSATQTAFQHNKGDPNPKSFQFTVTGVKP